MRSRWPRRLLAVLLACLGAKAAAQAPANDAWANRVVIPSLPFSALEAAVGAATVEATDPLVLCRTDQPTQGGNTVWYSYTTGATVEYLTFATAGSTYDTMVSVYTGSPGAFRLVAGGCNNDGYPTNAQSRLAGLRLAPATTYSIEVARLDPSTSAATLDLDVTTALRYQVTKVQDSADGACNADCSLREAIGASNAAPGAVLVPAGTYVLALIGVDDQNVSGDLDVLASVSVYGAGPGKTVVSGNTFDRAFHVNPDDFGMTALLADLTVTGGLPGGPGGGVLVAGRLAYFTLLNVDVVGNEATGDGGGLRTTVGGQVIGSAFRNNRASANGGGLAAQPASSSQIVVDVRDSTFNGNRSTFAGGGGGGLASSVQVTLTHTTVSGNRATFRGGGIHLFGSGSVELHGVTLANNQSDAATAQGGGVYLTTSGALTVRNSVLANNFFNPAAPLDNDCTFAAGTLASSYSHVEAPGTCTFAGTGDVTGSDPQLAPALRGNGGRTATHALLSGSPAVDSADPNLCRDGLGLVLTADQRGRSRQVDGNGDTVVRCDKGAYEFDPELIFVDGFEP
jgi:CSLREA domain-containing protein